MRDRIEECTVYFMIHPFYITKYREHLLRNMLDRNFHDRIDRKHEPIVYFMIDVV